MELKKIITIAPADLDLYGSVIFTRILQWMQRLADDHANELGVGRDILLSQNLVWMSARNTAQIHRPLRGGERISLHTWTGRNTHAACPRHFDFYDQSGRRIGGATALWMLIRPDTRRIVSPQKAGILMDCVFPDRPISVWPQRLPLIEDADYSVLYIPSYTDMDVNGHVNNARYAAWMLDAIPMVEFQTQFVSAMSINYLHEIKPDDHCQLMLKKKDEGYLFRGRSAKDGKDYFQARIELSLRD